MQTEADDMTESEFNEAVAAELRYRGCDRVANMSEQFDRDMATMSAATVAREEDCALTVRAVRLVADRRIDWMENHEPNPDVYA